MSCLQEYEYRTAEVVEIGWGDVGEEKTLISDDDDQLNLYF